LRLFERDIGDIPVLVLLALLVVVDVPLLTAVVAVVVAMTSGELPSCVNRLLLAFDSDELDDCRCMGDADNVLLLGKMLKDAFVESSVLSMTLPPVICDAAFPLTLRCCKPRAANVTSGDSCDDGDDDLLLLVLLL
jgi:hypothetical protein